MSDIGDVVEPGPQIGVHVGFDDVTHVAHQPNRPVT